MQHYECKPGLNLSASGKKCALLTSRKRSLQREVFSEKHGQLHLRPSGRGEDTDLLITHILD